MGHMAVEAGGPKPKGTRPTPKSKNKKSVGPSLKESLGTLKTEAGSKKGRKIDKTDNDMKPGAAGKKKGTVHRSSKESRGESIQGSAGPKKVADIGPSNETSGNGTKKPASKSEGKNSSVSSSRHFGQP